MGVDYDARFGIGYDLGQQGERIIGEEPVDIYDFLEEILEGTEFKHIKYGCGNYIGDDNSYCIVFSEPYDIFDLRPLKEKLDTLLKEKGLFDEIEGNFGLVGGMLMW